MCNVGIIDRILRALAGLIMITFVFIGPESTWGWLGLIPLTTAIIAYCPLYTVLGIKQSF